MVEKPHLSHIQNSKERLSPRWTGAVRQNRCFINLARAREREAFDVFGLLLTRRRNGGDTAPANMDGHNYTYGRPRQEHQGEDSSQFPEIMLTNLALENKSVK